MDRMVITGIDGQDRYVVENDEVTEVIAAHEHLMRWNDSPHVRVCVTCGQTEDALRLKGEKVVY
jgi:hypothetical protein